MSLVSLLANACNLLKDAASRKDQDPPDIGESLELLFGECSLANPEAQIEAARNNVFDSIRRLLPEETRLRDHLWMVASRVLMANNISWSHLNEHLQAFFDLAKRHFEEAAEDEEARGAIVMFLETVASFSASSPHFFRLFSENAEMATESVWLCGGSLLFFLGRAARLQRDSQLRQAVMQLMHSFSMEELMYMLQNNPDESKKGEWEVALLELYGAERGNPDVQALVSAGVLEGQLRDVCRCALGEKRSDKRSHVYSHDYLDVLVNISSVPEIAERMIAAGYLEVCCKALEIEKVDEGKKESVLVGQGACLETLSHVASFSHLRDSVCKALTAKPGGLAAAKERFEKLRGSKDPRIRAGAQRLLFELKWLSEEATPEEVLARGPEAEKAYHKALSLGKAHFKSMKLVLLGEDRSGKSSVLASVTGAGWDGKMQSTHGVSASRFKLGRKGWTEQPGGLTASEVAANATALLLRETSEEAAGDGAAAGVEGSPTSKEKKTGVSGGHPASGGESQAGGKSPGGAISKRGEENRERKTSLMDTFEVKQESDKRWRVKLTLHSDLTGKFECFSDLIGEGAAQEQRDVILQHVRPGLGPASPKVNKAVEELVPGFERPKPLNFVGLLKLAAAYGFKPSEAADAAQTLYVKGFISYPRTESSVFSDDEEAKLEDIVQDIANADLTWVCNEGAHIQRYAGKLLAQDSLKKPRRGFLATGDHEPITPLLRCDHACGRLDNRGRERDLYDLILRYFLASLSPDCVMQAKTVTIGFADIEVPFGGQFRVQHRTQVQQGWLEILPIDTSPLMLHAETPVLRQDAILEVVSAEVQEESPEAEKPLTVARLLHLMEVHGIGTDASIPEHFEKLLKREYFELCKKHFTPRVKMSEAYWAWHVLQDDEFEVEMFWNPAESKGNLLKLFVTDMGQALVTWLWNNERQLVQPTLRAEIEERTRAVAYSGESAGDVSRQLTEKFRDLYMSLAAKLDETDKDSFTGADLLRLLSPTRKGQRGNAKDDMKSCACQAMAKVDLRDLEVKRSATLQRHGPDLQHAESDREESPVAAVSTEHCLLPETLVLLDSGKFVRAEALEPGEQLLTSSETSAVMAIRESPGCDRETVVLHFMPDLDSSVKSLCILADQALLVQRSGERKPEILPAAAVAVGDRLSTKKGSAIVRGKEQVVRRSHAIQIDFPAPVATYIAEEEDLRPEAFVRSLGSFGSEPRFAIPDREQAHDGLKLPRCAGSRDKEQQSL